GGVRGAGEVVREGGGEVEGEGGGEGREREVGQEGGEVGRLESLLVVLDHVLLVEDRAHDARVRGRTADALLLELLDERRLREAGGWLREVLLGEELEEPERLALLERR